MSVPEVEPQKRVDEVEPTSLTSPQPQAEPTNPQVPKEKTKPTKQARPEVKAEKGKVTYICTLQELYKPLLVNGKSIEPVWQNNKQFFVFNVDEADSELFEKHYHFQCGKILRATGE